jgi:hypothetical protein
MDLRLLREWIRNPILLEGVSGQDLEAVLTEFPAFEAGYVLSLQRMKINHSSRFAKATVSYSAMTDQGQWLYRALERQAPEPQESENAPSEQGPAVKAYQGSGVDTRLGWFTLLGQVDWKALENDELESLYAEYTQTDYLEASSELPAPAASSEWSVAEDHGGCKPHPFGGIEMDRIRQMAARSLDLDELPVSESLAELCLEQGQKGMAVRIYRRLMLRFPAKSDYFLSRMDQLESSPRG